MPPHLVSFLYASDLGLIYRVDGGESLAAHRVHELVVDKDLKRKMGLGLGLFSVTAMHKWYKHATMTFTQLVTATEAAGATQFG